MATRWRLDTCNCELEFTDGNNIEGTGKFIKKCSVHSQDNLMTVVGENLGKNRAVMTLVTEHGLDPLKIGFEFEKKGKGRRHARIIVPIGTPDVKFDELDKSHTRLIRR